MYLKTPKFWYDRSMGDYLCGLLLLPLSAFYLLGHVLKSTVIRPVKPKIPVICIGNLTAGGSGKTPVAVAVMDIILKNSLAAAPCFLTRGYGGTLTGPLFANPEKHISREIGDEPLLLARHGTVIVSADRRAGAAMAEKHGNDLIIMDDGMQNPSLKKTLTLAVIDGSTGFGNGFPLPAGPLREPLGSGFLKADAFVLIGPDTRNIVRCLPDGKPLLRARLEVPETWVPNTKSPYIAFTGIGLPEKFRTTIQTMNLNLAEWRVFPDHHQFTPAELHHLDELAGERGGRLLTTEKDATRIPPHFSFKNPLDILPVRIVWENESALHELVKHTLRLS